MKKGLLIAALVCIGILGCSANAGGNELSDIELNVVEIDEIGLIKERISFNLWKETPNHYYDLVEYEGLLSEGIFLNVDYDSHDAAAWDTEKHLCYLKDITLQYGKETIESDAKIRNKILEGLQYWLDHRFTCQENWWFNVIKVPRDILELGILFEPYLTEDMRNSIKEITEGNTCLVGDLTWYGCNISDIANNSLMYASLMDDIALLDRIKATLEDDLVIRDNLAEDGIQQDMSYNTAHEGLNCGGSYGAIYCLFMSRLVGLLWDTDYEISNEKLELLIDHILDGENYFHMGMGVNYFSDGRHAVDAYDAHLVHDSARILADLEGIYRESELKEYLLSFLDNEYVNAGIKFFPNTYSLINKNKDFYMGIKGANDGFTSTQVQNGQGVLNYNLSYGSNVCYMHDGNEYSSIGAVLDFSMWPGITTYHESDAQLFQRYENKYGITWGPFINSGRKCVGRYSDETGKGVLCMNLLNDGLTGELAFFMYEDGIIALGSNMYCNRADNESEIRTSVNQCMASEPRLQDGQEVNELVEISKGNAVVNDGFVYVNLSDQMMYAANSWLSGSKSRGDSAGSDMVEEKQVFQCWFSYGNILKDGSYAYAVLDEGRMGIVDKDFTLSGITITNCVKVQAVEFSDGHYIVVFHESGEFELSNGTVIGGTKGEIISY